jgi:hypothetical protein
MSGRGPCATEAPNHLARIVTDNCKGTAIIFLRIFYSAADDPMAIFVHAPGSGRGSTGTPARSVTTIYNFLALR